MDWAEGGGARLEEDEPRGELVAEAARGRTARAAPTGSLAVGENQRRTRVWFRGFSRGTDRNVFTAEEQRSQKSQRSTIRRKEIMNGSKMQGGRAEGFSLTSRREGEAGRWWKP